MSMMQIMMTIFLDMKYSHSKLLKVLERAPFLYIFVYVYVCLRLHLFTNKTSQDEFWDVFYMDPYNYILDNKRCPGDVLETKEMIKRHVYIGIFYQK